MSHVVRHTGYLAYLRTNLFNAPKTKISLDKFTLRKLNKDELIRRGNIPVNEAYTLNDGNKEIGYFQYRSSNGQLGTLHLEKEYRGYGIMNQVLKRIILDMKYAGAKRVFAVTIPNHPYFSKIPNMEWTEPAGIDVTGSGYSIAIKDLESFIENEKTS